VRKRVRASAITGGIFLIGLAFLLLTNWWWPGIMVVIGLAGCSEFVFRGKIGQGIGILAFFLAIPFVLWIVDAIRIPWRIAGPLILIGIGAIVLAGVVYRRNGP
jgi:hypothetical protein